MLPNTYNRPRLTTPFRDEWTKAYDIAKRKLSKPEFEWLENAQLAGDEASSPIKMAEDARWKMEDKQ